MPSHVIPGTTANTPRGRLTRRYGQARLALSAELTAQAGAITGRTDLVVSTVTATTVGAPGVFYPDRAEIEVEAHLFEKQPRGRRAPAPSNPKARPAGYGVFLHESAHAVHSAWRPADGAGAAQVAAAMMLEEIRIEAAHTGRRPSDRYWLRHAARSLILDEAQAAPVATRWASAHTLALIVGRADAGILRRTESAPVLLAAEKVLGAQLVDSLRDVWIRALSVSDHDAPAMMAAAAEWCVLLGIDPADRDPAQQQGPATAEQAAAATRLGRAVTSALKRVAAGLATEKEPADPAPEPNTPTGSPVIRSAVPWDDPASPVTGRRAPTSAEVAQAAALAQRLTHAGLRSRTAVAIASDVPPGRLNMRALLARDAQRSAGALATAKPWRRTVHRTSPTPSLRVGIAVDVSGSMVAFTGPVAQVTWIMAQAVRRAGPDGACATAAFGGTTVTGITRPGQTPDQVIEFAARSMGHPAADAIAHLERALTLARPGAARLLVIVTDGRWTSEERDPASARIARLRESGCAVLHLSTAGETARPVPGATLATLGDPAQTAAVIGDAAVAALSAVR